MEEVPKQESPLDEAKASIDSIEESLYKLEDDMRRDVREGVPSLMSATVCSEKIKISLQSLRDSLRKMEKK